MKMKMKMKMKIKYKLILPMILIFIIGLGIYLPLSYYNIKKDLNETIDIAAQTRVKGMMSLFVLNDYTKKEFEIKYHDIITSKIYSPDIHTNNKKLKNIFIKSYPIIVDSKGTFIYYIKKDLEGKAPIILDKKDNKTNIIQKIIKIKNGSFEYWFTKPNKKGIFKKKIFFGYYPKYDYYIAYAYYINDVNNMIITSFIKIAIPAILMALFVLISSYIFINKIVKNINKTKNSLLDISEGEGDLTKELEIKTNDELEELSDYFNQFIFKLQDIVKATFIEIDNLTEIKKKTLDIVKIITNKSYTVDNESNKIVEEVNKLNEIINENASSIEEISANLESINKQIIDQSAMVEEATASITEMISSITNTAGITEKKLKNVNELVNIIDNSDKELLSTENVLKEEVIERIDGIKKMAVVIQDIAAQTNLLAINAAIEAAHSDQKGFAVIANEIRKLAENSSKSSDEIVKIIKDIFNGVENTEFTINKTRKSFNKIISEMSDVKNAFEEINLSTQELNEGGKQILEAMNELQNISVSVKNSSEEVSLGMKEGVKLQENLKDVSTEVANNSNEIKNETNKITIEIDKQNNILDKLDNSLKALVEKFVFKV